jgi:cell fate regulator YaaT (PSP1 superfamily)
MPPCESERAAIATCGCLNRSVVAPQLEDWIRVVVDPELPPLPCRAGQLVLHHGDTCVVETPDGFFLGRITILTSPVLRSPHGATGRVVRLANRNDVERNEALEALARDIEKYLRGRIRELSLELRPIKVRLPLSGRKAMVFFTTEQRVDFRPLLKELGRRFRRRVEMRPLGVRDGARLSGGIGPCGRGLCCATFMERFHSVTVRMAKRQNLSLNPTKISGLCGRLMCCLAHEVEQYPSKRGKPKGGNKDGNRDGNKGG